MRYWCNCHVVVQMLLCLMFVSGEKQTKLVNNGYEGVVIAIDPRVPEDPGLIVAIEDMMTDASVALFEATRNRAYFRNVTILVPKSWNTNSYSYASIETFDNADIRVSPPQPQLADRPYARLDKPCGEPGLFIHLTSAFITEEKFIRNYGPRGKTVVHEWAHFRWGVRDEYPTGRTAQELNKNSFYFDLASGLWEAARCSLGISGEVRYGSDECELDGLLPPPGCRFRRSGNQLAELRSSLMYQQFIDGVTRFCDDDPSDELNMHNNQPDNEQNTACNRKSTWDVILGSEDFQRGMANNPNTSIANIFPTFNIVKHQTTRIVLVLDTSGSMAGERILIQRFAANLLITNIIGDGSSVGLVQFDSTARVLKGLTEVNHGDGSRDDLAAELPSSAFGATGIGDGILKGVEVLEDSGEAVAGGQIFVLTDGEENTPPYIEDLSEMVVQKGIVVSAIFFGLSSPGQADSLAKLSNDSGGKWYYSPGNSRSQLVNVFATFSQPIDGDLSTAAVQVSSSDFEVGADSTTQSSVAIDSSIGRRTEFIFSWSSLRPEIEITPPGSNCVYSNERKETVTYCSQGSRIDVTDTVQRTVKFTIPGTAEAGRWEYNITSTDDGFVTLAVTSAPSVEGVYPIKVDPKIQILGTSGNEAALVTSSVFQNDLPVVGANVTATISRPVGEDATIQLLDNGAGADVAIDDGVYSRYFTNFSSQGRYSIQVKVLKSGSDPVGIANTPQAPADPGSILGNGNFDPNPDYEEFPLGVRAVEFTGDLERVASSPSIEFNGTITDNDTYPPNKITDLSASQVDLEDATAGIRLTFTAPGDDFDEGRASRYDVRMTNESIPTLLSEFELQIPVNISNGTDLIQPNSAHEKEEFIVFLSPRSFGDTIVRISIAIRAYDEAENPSEISNVASTTFFFEPPSRPLDRSVDIRIIIGAAVGGGLGLIILVAIVVCIIVAMGRK